MNRRSFFGTLLAAPVAVQAIAEPTPAFGRWFRSWKPASAVLHSAETVQIAIVVPQGRTTEEMVDSAMRQLPRGLHVDGHGIRQALEGVIRERSQ
jgi:hypothetical protein